MISSNIRSCATFISTDSWTWRCLFSNVVELVTELKNIENLGETSAASTSENCYVSHLLPQGPGTDQLSLMEEARESLLVVEEESHSPNKSSECFKIGVKSIYQTMLYGLSVCYMSGAQRRPCSGFYTRWQKGCSIL
ncbi:uncharacterized protein LOC144547714 isoform X2 [Carex rostrata]